MTEQKLFDWLLPKLTQWQDRLGLQAWGVSLEIKRKEDIDGYQGRCTFQPCLMEATIYILSPLDWREEYDKEDMEATLVHELLHIVFYWYTPSPTDNTLEHQHLEQAITRIERALVEKYCKKRISIKLEGPT